MNDLAKTKRGFKKRSALPDLRGTAMLVFGVFLLILLLLHSDIAMDGVRCGLSLCIETLFPSLFPFLALSELFVASGAGERLGRLFSRPVSALFGLSEGGAAALLLGTFCGFPVATSTAVALRSRGELSKDELARLVLFANNPSSGFLIGATGVALFGNRGAGVALFVITLLSAATVGVFLRVTRGKVTRGEGRALPRPVAKTGLSSGDLTAAVRRAFSTLLQVFSFVLFFSCISKCLTASLTALSLPRELGVALTGVFELTAGVSAAVTALSPTKAFLFSAFFAGFAGLSVALQIFSVAEGEGLSLFSYLLARMAQGTIALFWATLYLLLFRPSFSVAESVAATGHLPAAGTHPIGKISFLLFLLLFLLVLPQGKKKKSKRFLKGN